MRLPLPLGASLEVETIKFTALVDGRLCGKRYLEGGALADGTRHVDCAAVRVNDRFYDKKPQACSANLLMAIQAGEPAKELLNFMRLHSASGILNSDGKASARLRQRNSYRAALWRKFNRVTN